jgi:2-iminobutanoate/2-iminopropanoate deaminase
MAPIWWIEGQIMRNFIAALALLACAGPALADKSEIQTDAGPKAIGPYSQAIKTGNLVFVSGQLPFDPQGKIDYSKQDVTAQTKRCLDNVVAILAAANLTLDDAVSVTVYVTDVADFAAVNAVYASYFKPPYPARAFVQVAKLLRDAKVEIAVTAAAH